MNEEGEYVRGTSMWTKEKGASVPISLRAPRLMWSQLSTLVSGEMDVYVRWTKASDGQYQLSRKRSQKGL